MQRENANRSNKLGTERGRCPRYGKDVAHMLNNLGYEKPILLASDGVFDEEELSIFTAKVNKKPSRAWVVLEQIVNASVP
jgi:nicotinic acid phosphoribosyltransferase